MKVPVNLIYIFLSVQFLIQTVHMEHMVVNPFVKEAAVDVCQDISCQGPKNIALVSLG